VETERQGHAVILTDGMWSDQNELLMLTQDIADQVSCGRRALTRFTILVYETNPANNSDVEGIEKLMLELLDYDPGVDVDIWDWKRVNELNNYSQLFTEHVRELSLGIGGCVLDDQRNVVLRRDEFNFDIQFELPATSMSFTLVLDGVGEYQQRIP